MNAIVMCDCESSRRYPRWSYISSLFIFFFHVTGFLSTNRILQITLDSVLGIVYSDWCEEHFSEKNLWGLWTLQGGCDTVLTQPRMSWTSAHMECQHSSTHTCRTHSPQNQCGPTFQLDVSDEWRESQSSRGGGRLLLYTRSKTCLEYCILCQSAWMVWELPNLDQIKFS